MNNKDISIKVVCWPFRSQYWWPHLFVVVVGVSNYQSINYLSMLYIMCPTKHTIHDEGPQSSASRFFWVPPLHRFFNLCWITKRFTEIMLCPIFASSVCVVDVVVVVVVVNFSFKHYLLWSLQTDWLQHLCEASWCGSLPMSRQLLCLVCYYRRIRH